MYQFFNYAISFFLFLSRALEIDKNRFFQMTIFLILLLVLLIGVLFSNTVIDNNLIYLN